MLRAIFLDAGGTLLAERCGRAMLYAEAFAAHGQRIATDAMASAMARAHAALPREIDGHFRYSDPWFRAFIVQVAAQTGFAGAIAPIERDLFRKFADPRTFAIFSDVKHSLSAIRASGIATIGVISNWSPHLERLLGHLGLGDLRPVVASAVVRCEKPEPSIFRTAAALAGVAPNEAAHIGDHATNDFAGARAAGMRALWLRRSLPSTGGETIRSLDEVANHIRTWQEA